MGKHNNELVDDSAPLGFSEHISMMGAKQMSLFLMQDAGSDIRPCLLVRNIRKALTDRMVPNFSGVHLREMFFTYLLFCFVEVTRLQVTLSKDMSPLSGLGSDKSINAE